MDDAGQPAVVLPLPRHQVLHLVVDELLAGGGDRLLGHQEIPPDHEEVGDRGHGLVALPLPEALPCRHGVVLLPVDYVVLQYIW